MIAKFNSSAINTIATEGDTVTVEFNGGRQYDYKTTSLPHSCSKCALVFM